MPVRSGNTGYLDLCSSPNGVLHCWFHIIIFSIYSNQKIASMYATRENSWDPAYFHLQLMFETTQLYDEHNTAAFSSSVIQYQTLYLEESIHHPSCQRQSQLFYFSNYNKHLMFRVQHVGNANFRFFLHINIPSTHSSSPHTHSCWKCRTTNCRAVFPYAICSLKNITQHFTYLLQQAPELSTRNSLKSKNNSQPSKCSSTLHTWHWYSTLSSNVYNVSECSICLHIWHWYSAPSSNVYIPFLNAQYFCRFWYYGTAQTTGWNALLELVCRQYKSGDRLDGYTVNTTSGDSLNGCSYYYE